MRFSAKSKRGLRNVAAAAGLGMLALSGSFFPAVTASASTSTPAATSAAGLAPGAIKHVWLIILENKSYDATFSGLNNNSYLWKTLPSQGVELKNYYGTGHSSMDNYLSLVSGQAPNEDVQEDCSTSDTLINTNAGIETSGGSLAANPNYGQLDSKGGANAPLGSNGCSFPTEVPTLFNQLNAAGVTWKGYAQDLTGEQNYLQDADQPYVADTVPGREDAACGGAGTSANNPNTDPTNLVAPTGDVTSFTGAQNSTVKGTDYIDQYVAKHFPFPWFESLTGQVNASGGNTPPLNEPAGGDNCDADHIANLDSPTQGLVHDLQSEATTPAFSWITPDNCSDAHDATCKGNNLSGAFNANGTPNYELGTAIAYDPEAIPPTNNTGGLYAADLFLEYYIPLIEQSPAFKDGGLIDVTFDEADPPFTYSGNSFNNQPTSSAAAAPTATQGDTSIPPTCTTNAQGVVVQPCTPSFGSSGSYAPGASSVYGAYGIYSDAAGENINGKNVATEPTGPNSTLSTNSQGQQLDPGPGNNAFIDRPPACTSTTPDTPSNCVPGIVEGGSGSSPAARTDSSATGTSTSSIISDPSILADDTGRLVTGTNIPAGSFVGTVTDSLIDQEVGQSANVQNFQLVDDNGNPVDPTGAVSGVTLSAETAPSLANPSAASNPTTADPLYDADDPTPGGGDTGSVLISPYITPGTSTTTYYNHYSWLRTMEDVFNVSSCSGTSSDVSIPDGSVCGGIDGQGHIGYAAQAGLAAFGTDVFNNPAGSTPNPSLPESPLTVGLPIVAVAIGGTYVGLRRRSRRKATAAS